MSSIKSPNIGAVCRKCRRAGEKLFLKGSRCVTPKCAITRRNYGPGVHGQDRRGRVSEYGMQLREKQKVKRIYGINETQIRNYFEKANRQKGITSDVLLALIERRLDNVVYRLGLAPSRRAARQVVSHALIAVNCRRVNIPSFTVKKGDIISIKESKKEKKYFKKLAEELKNHSTPSWMSLNSVKIEGEINALPERKDFDISADMQLIIEFYSR